MHSPIHKAFFWICACRICGVGLRPPPFVILPRKKVSRAETTSSQISSEMVAVALGQDLIESHKVILAKTPIYEASEDLSPLVQRCSRHLRRGLLRPCTSWSYQSGSRLARTSLSSCSISLESHGPRAPKFPVCTVDITVGMTRIWNNRWYVDDCIEIHSYGASPTVACLHRRRLRRPDDAAPSDRTPRFGIRLSVPRDDTNEVWSGARRQRLLHAKVTGVARLPFAARSPQ